MKCLKLQTSKFDRVAKKNVGTTRPLIQAGDVFALENGYYFNEDESIVIKSTDKTGTLFTKTNEKSTL